MTIQGLITEYNPFHLGHKYHLEQSKNISNAEFTIAVMSGSFLQRGEPAFIDKWTRAKMAIDNGVDLVLELPFIFSSQSAEHFAYGGVKLLDSLNIVDYISFGSEFGELEALYEIAHVFFNEPEYFKERLKYYLSTGLSYSISRSRATEEYINTISNKMQYNYKDILNKSNNILGIEYLKALIRLNSSIKPITIKRSGSNYNDKSISTGFASATGLRNQIKTKDLNSVKQFIPHSTFKYLDEFFNENNYFNYLKNYNQVLIYLIRTLEIEGVKNLLDIENGLENRIVDMGFKYNDIEEIIDNIVTKRYPRTRIQRLLIHLLHQLDKDTFHELKEVYPNYIRVLGANKNGLNLLNKIKKNSDIPIITKFADYKLHKDKLLEKCILLDKKSTDLFFIGLNPNNPKSNMDYYISPYIRGK